MFGSFPSCLLKCGSKSLSSFPSLPYTNHSYRNIKSRIFSDSLSETCKVTWLCAELSMLCVGIFLTEDCEREGLCTLWNVVTCYTGVSVRRNLYVKLQIVTSQKMLNLVFCACIFHMNWERYLESLHVVAGTN
jgi:hypothetical protein